jgi:DnaJ-class molecular chaperone
MTIARKQCDKCKGEGTVARERRKLADGSPDPLDPRHSELCSACGGAGSVPDVRDSERTVKTGIWMADQIGDAAT